MILFLFLLTIILNSVNIYQKSMINTVKYWENKSISPVIYCVV